MAQGERLHTLIPGSTLDAIADVGHIPHIEDEQAFLGGPESTADGLQPIH